MDSPSYLEPAIGLWDWIIWGRLGSNSSGIYRLLKAIWQCFHTLISVAGLLTVGGGRQNEEVPTWHPHLQEYKTTNNCTVCCVPCNVEVKVIRGPVGPLTCILVFTTWDVSPSLPAWLIYVLIVPGKWRDFDFQHGCVQNKQTKQFFSLDWNRWWLLQAVNMKMIKILCLVYYVYCANCTADCQFMILQNCK